ncbi:hypothetical protein J2T13_005091 [Paenibacillus sp. DS2015]|uniref:hypothetical protein n=1 Tax=Paenibacillus sp. DS2015 TaxID=3373917 RepID=UPI003D20DAF2
MKIRTKPRESSNLLMCLHFFLGIGAVIGGLILMIDPTGEMIDMPASMLVNSPFEHFFIPGFILLTCLGVFPILIATALKKRWNWELAKKLNLYQDKHWSWAFSLYCGFALIIWITVQVYMINTVSLIHVFYMLLGILIQIVTLLPQVQRKYQV